MTGDIHPSSTHPPLPPTTEDERLCHLRLLRSRRVGPSTYHTLLAEHGTALAALEALPEVARTAGLKDYEICTLKEAQAELEAGQRAGARLLIHGRDEYPAPLTDLTDAPPLLWALGNTDLLRAPMLSIVGARNASALGTRMAKSLTEELGRAGYVIVSGLARGIDAAAHEAALATGTIAVQAGGVDTIYPAQNSDLSTRIAETGLRLSEQPMGLRPLPRHFPARNRIVAGLSKACIVIEAAAKSGSLITARDAADLGRDVLAVPGHPYDARAAGCNFLIRDGATLVRSARDVIEALTRISQLSLLQTGHQENSKAESGPLQSGPSTSPTTDEPDIKELHRIILARLGPGPVPEDDLLRDLGQDPTHLSHAITDLELSGTIKRHDGGLLSRLN